MASERVSRTDAALRALAAIVGRPGIPSFRDWSLSDLGQLAAILGSTEKHETAGAMFVRTPFAVPESTPWVELLAAVGRETGGLLDVDGTQALKAVKLIAPVERGTRATAQHQPLEARPLEVPINAREVLEARARLFRWAELERRAPVGCEPVFSQLVGGVRPTVYVFDDYNRYIREADATPDTVGLRAFELGDPTDLTDEAAGRYLPSRSISEFRRLLGSHCGNLNNLSIAFAVRAPKVELTSGDGPSYERVAHALPLSELDTNRSTIAAFVVDLEWRPTDANAGADLTRWAEVGHLGIDLLSRRFPEIPCFVYTGQWSIEKLQDSLSHGARWCFWRESHHGYATGKPHQITSLSLSAHLARSAQGSYGAFADAPYTSQLRFGSDELATKLDLRLPVGSCSRGTMLQRVVARLFPDGATISPLSVPGSGRSKAKAFFASVTSGRSRSATRFVKLGPWLDIWKEYAAYEGVIRPRLNSHVANVIGKPVYAGNESGGMPMGALLYSLAGLPEGYDDLRPLKLDLVGVLKDPKSASEVGARLCTTLQDVLFPLHGLGGIGEADDRDGRTIGSWLGRVLPATQTGRLAPLHRTADRERSVLKGYYLDEVQWQVGEHDPGELTLRDPNSGQRVRLRADSGELRRRFGAAWVRPGFPTELHADLDRASEHAQKTGKIIEAAAQQVSFSPLANQSRLTISFEAVELPDPLATLLGPSEVLGKVITARQGPIHGDLNLENIIFPRGSSLAGWLIDFERAEASGMLALDFAKLEVEICCHVFFPLLHDLSPADAVLPKLLLYSREAVCSRPAGTTFEELARASLPSGKTRQVQAACGLLDIVQELRNMVAKAKIKSEELDWALAAQFLAWVKFAPPNKPWAALSPYLASAWHLKQATSRDVKP